MQLRADNCGERCNLGFVGREIERWTFSNRGTDKHAVAREAATVQQRTGHFPPPATSIVLEQRIVRTILAPFPCHLTITAFFTRC
jgi:hypothetical protein